jgi:hypothetical protein
MRVSEQRYGMNTTGLCVPFSGAWLMLCYCTVGNNMLISVTGFVLTKQLFIFSLFAVQKFEVAMLLKNHGIDLSADLI